MNIFKAIGRVFEFVFKSVGIFIGVIVGLVIGTIGSMFLIDHFFGGFSFSSGGFWQLVPGAILALSSGVKAGR